MAFVIKTDKHVARSVHGSGLACPRSRRQCTVHTKSEITNGTVSTGLLDRTTEVGQHYFLYVAGKVERLASSLLPS